MGVAKSAQRPAVLLLLVTATLVASAGGRRGTAPQAL
jgi:hypothetical protein